MIIKRDGYLKKLIERKHDGYVKNITGICCCGKSFLLNPLFKQPLLEQPDQRAGGGESRCSLMERGSVNRFGQKT